jgi:hypothetical protein
MRGGRVASAAAQPPPAQLTDERRDEITAADALAKKPRRKEHIDNECPARGRMRRSAVSVGARCA